MSFGFVEGAIGPVLGTLYGTDAMRTVFAEAAWFARMLEVEAALARVQARLGIIPQAAADAITAAASADGTLDAAAMAASTRVVGYPVVGLVAGLSRAAGEAGGGWTHWGATTQDIMDTATVLQVRAGLDLVAGDLDGLCAALARLASTHRGTVMAGRTHLQHALPITFGLKCASWLMPLAAHRERLAQLRPRVELVELGGAAGTLASLGGDGIAVMEGLAVELGLGAPAAPWHAARDGFSEAVGFLGLLCGSLMKIALDVSLLAQTEIGEVSEGYVAGRGSSSTMPQKRNPISGEYVIANGRGAQAMVPLMQGAMAQDHERATGPWQAELLALPQAFVLAHGSLVHARTMIEGLVVNAAAMRRNLDASRGLIVAEAVMMGLAPTLGREAAHHAVKHACDRALADGSELAAALGHEPDVAAALDAEAIARLVDPAGYLGSSNVFIDRVLTSLRTTA